MSEPAGHTFLLRIWLEATPEEAGTLVWRGFLVHLLDEEYTYVESIDDITRFICGHLG
jgi:hypothetical protein